MVIVIYQTFFYHQPVCHCVAPLLGEIKTHIT